MHRLHTVPAKAAIAIGLSSVLTLGCHNARALNDADGRLRRFAEALATSQAAHTLRHRFCLKLADHPERAEDCATLNALISRMEERMAAHPEEGPRCPDGKGSADEENRCSCEWAWVQIGAAKAAPSSWTNFVQASNFSALPKSPLPSFLAQMEQSGAEQASKFWTLGCKAPPQSTSAEGRRVRARHQDDSTEGQTRGRPSRSSRRTSTAIRVSQR